MMETRAVDGQGHEQPVHFVNNVFDCAEVNNISALPDGLPYPLSYQVSLPG
jgi:hypothetical protein